MQIHAIHANTIQPCVEIMYSLFAPPAPTTCPALQKTFIFSLDPFPFPDADIIDLLGCEQILCVEVCSHTVPVPHLDSTQYYCGMHRCSTNNWSWIVHMCHTIRHLDSVVCLPLTVTLYICT